MPNRLFWLGGLSPFRGPAASETLIAEISEGRHGFASMKMVVHTFRRLHR
jgi:hypothetical protein